MKPMTYSAKIMNVYVIYDWMPNFRLNCALLWLLVKRKYFFNYISNFKIGKRTVLDTLNSNCRISKMFMLYFHVFYGSPSYSIQAIMQDGTVGTPSWSHNGSHVDVILARGGRIKKKTKPTRLSFRIIAVTTHH